MIKKITVCSLILAGALCFAPVNADGNNLVQMDIKKTAPDGVNFTLYTSDNYGGNIVVTKKSDNKYVVIMPHIAGNSPAKPSLNGVKDVISNVDIKTVPDGGYTKITVITTKPLNIRARSQKSAPASQEQLAYKQVISKTQTHTNAPVTQPKKVTSPTKVTVSQPAKTDVKKQTAKKVEPPKTVQKKETAVKPALAVKELPKQIKEPPKKVEEVIPAEEVKDVMPIFEPTAATQDAAIKRIEKTVADNSPQKEGNTLPAMIFMILFPILGISLLIKVIKDSLQKSRTLKKAFLENIAPKPEPKNYDNIIEEKDISWQERYKKFSEAANISKSDSNTAKPQLFISKPKSAVSKPVINEVTDIDETKIEEKRNELERIMEKHENTEIIQSQPKEKPFEPTKVEIEVKNEAETIPNQVSNSIKLKSFKDKPSLEETHRERIQTKLKKFEIVEDLDKRKNAEAKDNVVLGDSLLHSNPRKFPQAALKVSDLMAKGNRILNETKLNRNMIQDPEDFIMATVDEYFALLDEEKAEKIANIAPDRLDFSKAAASAAKPVSREMTNPISKQTLKNIQINGLTVKAGYEIDKNRGFYLVNLYGTTALVGRVGEDITVIKKFDENISDLQVRKDKENSYMVKAGDFRSLVDVGERKMGVLIEL